MAKEVTLGQENSLKAKGWMGGELANGVERKGQIFQTKVLWYYE